MATAGAGLKMEGVEKFDSLSQQIEESFLQYHSLLESHKVKLLERVMKMKKLYLSHRDIDKAIKQMEGVIRATNEMVTEDLVAENKEQIVGLWDDKIRALKRDKNNLEAVSELKFLPNIEEFTQCVNNIHLRDCVSVEYNKRREPVVMKGKRGAGEEGLGSASDVTVDRETDLVYVAGCLKDVICVYSLEGEFVRKFGNKISYPKAICLSKDFVFVLNTGNSIAKFSKNGLYLSNTKSVQTDFKLKRCENLCAYNDQTLYVCNSEDKIIEIFTFDLTYTGNFGKGAISSPMDIKIHNNTIFILNDFAGKIHSYNTQHVYLTSIHLKGYDNLILDRIYLTIDLNGNFIVNSRDDNLNSCLKVFSFTGELIELLGCGYLTRIRGIDIDKHSKIVSLSNSSLNCFQVY